MNFLSQSLPLSGPAMKPTRLPSRRLWICSLGTLALSAALTTAQVPDAQPASAPPPAASSGGAAPAGGAKPAGGGQKGTLGNDAPFFDPGSETLTWDGKSWNINNNRVFQARFEKYLNAPEETSAVDLQYQAVIAQVLNYLAPGNATTQNIDSAFRLLPRGSSFDIDARLCDALADAVYSAWKANRQQDRLSAANDSLDSERRQQYWNARHADAGETTKAPPPKATKGGQAPPSSANYSNTMVQTDLTKRIAEIEAQIKGNQVKRELSAIQAKVEFQALILQFFLQRRFQHVLMATRFYRATFTDGDTKLNVGKDTKDLFEKSSGMPPTVGTLDSMANEALRDVREGVRAYDFLLEKNELDSASKRLAEAFTVGEYVPEIRTLAREKKRRALDYVQKGNQLISALEVKDYALAEQLVTEMGKVAKDFDNSKPMAAIETSKTVAQMHLAKARNAALSGDRPTLEAELTAATELWPRNPALKEISGMIFAQGDTLQKTLVDFDQLLSQKNYRGIFDDKGRFIAATVQYPDRKKQLEDVLENVQRIDIAMMQANAMSQQRNYAGAWESLEMVAEKAPDDNKLSQARANLTTQAADFVRTLRSAQDLEKKEQVGSSLAWYLKAKKLYPGSGFASDGIDRLVHKIVPQS